RRSDPLSSIGRAASLAPQLTADRPYFEDDPVEMANGRDIGQTLHISDHLSRSGHLHAQSGLLPHLTDNRVRRMLAVLNAATWQEPSPRRVAVVRLSDQQDPAVLVAEESVCADATPLEHWPPPYGTTLSAGGGLRRLRQRLLGDFGHRQGRDLTPAEPARVRCGSAGVAHPRFGRPVHHDAVEGAHTMPVDRVPLRTERGGVPMARHANERQ